MTEQSNIIFWGAGATAALGMRTTDQQTKFIKRITGSQPLNVRITEALDTKDTEPWHSALFDLITILGDGDDGYDSIDNITPEQLQAMSRNWQPGAGPRELEKRILALRLIYDWPALKSVVRICPGTSGDNFKLNDLFNLLDMHIPPGFGFRAPIPRRSEESVVRSDQQFFDARRLIGAKNALLMILISSFYIDYQICVRSSGDVLQKYYEFAIVLARRMQCQGLNLVGQYRLDHPEFYKCDTTFVSLNYDPIALWLQFNANRELNKRVSVPHIGSPAVPLHIFADFGHLIPARRIGQGDGSWPWYAMNEATVQRLNEQSASDLRVRLIKFLFPHGSLCWRECPDCGKLSAYHGDQWGIDAAGLFPPPPLLAFDTRRCPARIHDSERNQRIKGKVDARRCLHCGTLTFAQQTQAVMQSSFKAAPPSFIEEIQRDLRATTMQASHVIFMGYSLPPDDVTYRAFFSARRHRGEHSNGESQPVRCTVVDWNPENPSWYGPTELESRMQQWPHSFPENRGVRAARDIFGAENVRFFGGGVPEVFLEAGRVTETALERLLNWS